MFIITDEVSSESWECKTFDAAKAKIHDLLAGPYRLQQFIDEQVVPQFNKYCFVVSGYYQINLTLHKE